MTPYPILLFVQNSMFHHKIPNAYGGERGIRTPGRFPVNGFQDRRFRPLSQLSKK